MAAFAGPWPEWPAEDQGKQLVSVRVDWDVDKLSRALFGSSSAFGVRIRSLQIIGLCLPARHGPDYPLRRPPPLRFLPPDDAAGPKCYAVFLCLAALGEAWESKDYVETPWQDSEAALASGPAPAPPPKTIDADVAAGPTALGQARRTSFNELGWFGKKVRNEMVQRAVEVQPGRSYTVDEVACCSVSHGEKFRPIMRFQLTADGAGSRLKVLYTIVYVQKPNAITRFGIQRAVDKDMVDSFRTLVDVLRKHVAVKDAA